MLNMLIVFAFAACDVTYLTTTRRNLIGYNNKYYANDAAILCKFFCKFCKLLQFFANIFLFHITCADGLHAFILFYEHDMVYYSDHLEGWEALWRVCLLDSWPTFSPYLHNRICSGETSHNPLLCFTPGLFTLEWTQCLICLTSSVKSTQLRQSWIKLVTPQSILEYTHYACVFHRRLLCYYNLPVCPLA